MQALQKEWTTKGVAWFTVISSAPGAQGYVTPVQENDYLAKMHAVPTAALLDPDGKVGRLYNAKTTPDMFVIDPQGKLIYAGAIDILNFRAIQNDARTSVVEQRLQFVHESFYFALLQLLRKFHNNYRTLARHSTCSWENIGVRPKWCGGSLFVENILVFCTLVASGSHFCFVAFGAGVGCTTRTRPHNAYVGNLDGRVARQTK
jgi:hypothetical protein